MKPLFFIKNNEAKTLRRRHPGSPYVDTERPARANSLLYTTTGKNISGRAEITNLSACHTSKFGVIRRPSLEQF